SATIKANKTLARDNHRGDHHRAATLTRHPDRRALPTQIVALYTVMHRRSISPRLSTNDSGWLSTGG
ncbi:hypothetical protein, partial [Bradyrhizobium brasilense]|uniref:hypothetical protein n=1 Tax=Bradyrhizobium brasilense TaxID=1419277 RepID=UPI001AEE25D2